MKMKHVLAVLISIIMVLSLAACGGTSSGGKETAASTANKDEAIENLSTDPAEAEADPAEAETPEREEEPVAEQELPDINDYPLLVEGTGDLDVEIFFTVEDGRSINKDLVRYAVTRFNEKNVQNSSGQTISVSLRCLEPALAERYIKTGTYVPRGIICVDAQHMMNTAAGIEEELVESKMIETTIGIAVPNDYDGDMDVESVVKAVADGQLSFGYTNPINSPAGLNFFVSMLTVFDSSNPGSAEATARYSEFQNNVTVVCSSTEQLNQKIADGIINSFAMEHQAFLSKSMEKEYTFIPFGMREDYALYQVGVNDDEKDVLKQFGGFFASDIEVQATMSHRHFGSEEYESSVNPQDYAPETASDIYGFLMKTFQ